MSFKVGDHCPWGSVVHAVDYEGEEARDDTPDIMLRVVPALGHRGGIPRRDGGDRIADGWLELMLDRNVGTGYVDLIEGRQGNRGVCRHYK